MKLVTHEKTLSEKEYLLFELQSDIRHEYINGKLIDMPGESDLRLSIAAGGAFHNIQPGTAAWSVKIWIL